MLKIKLFLALVWLYSGIAFSKSGSNYTAPYKGQTIFAVIQQNGDKFMLSADDHRYFNKWSQMAFCLTVDIEDGYRHYSEFKKLTKVIGYSGFRCLTDRTAAFSKFYQ